MFSVENAEKSLIWQAEVHKLKKEMGMHPDSVLPSGHPDTLFPSRAFEPHLKPSSSPPFPIFLLVVFASISLTGALIHAYMSYKRALDPSKYQTLPPQKTSQ